MGEKGSNWKRSSLTVLEYRFLSHSIKGQSGKKINRDKVNQLVIYFAWQILLSALLLQKKSFVV
jgi:hypothetical protein